MAQVLPWRPWQCLPNLFHHSFTPPSEQGAKGELTVYPGCPSVSSFLAFSISTDSKLLEFKQSQRHSQTISFFVVHFIKLKTLNINVSWVSSPPQPLPSPKVKYVSVLPHQKETILSCAQRFVGVGVFRNHFWEEIPEVIVIIPFTPGYSSTGLPAINLFLYPSIKLPVYKSIKSTFYINLCSNVLKSFLLCCKEITRQSKSH